MYVEPHLSGEQVEDLKQELHSPAKSHGAKRPYGRVRAECYESRPAPAASLESLLSLSLQPQVRPQGHWPKSQICMCSFSDSSQGKNLWVLLLHRDSKFVNQPAGGSSPASLSAIL